MEDPVRRTEFVGQLIATDAMTSFQGTRRIVQAGVNNAAIARTCAHPNIRKGFKHEHIAPAQRQSPSDRAAHNTTTDDHYIGLFHGLHYFCIRSANSFFPGRLMNLDFTYENATNFPALLG